MGLSLSWFVLESVKPQIVLVKLIVRKSENMLYTTQRHRKFDEEDAVVFWYVSGSYCIAGRLKFH